jgi:hypothetical protein
MDRAYPIVYSFVKPPRSVYTFHCISGPRKSPIQWGVSLLRTLGFIAIVFLSSQSAFRGALPLAVRAGGQTPRPGPLRTFTGTITRNGDQFVLNEEKTHTLYELDDQNAASKFEEKKVIVTGTVDGVKNVIRIQSIAEATA